MGYYSDDETNKILKALENRIKKEYKRAYEEMSITAQEYFDTLADRYAKEYKAYQAGEYTKAEFDAWYRTQVERGHGYEKMRDDLAHRMTTANEVASAYINDKTPSIFALNANYEAYKIEGCYDNVNFQIYDEQAVRNLMIGRNQIEFKTVSVNPVRDYAWNREKITNALLSGILQGKSIDKLSDSFLSVMKRNRTSAIRNARTSFTSAQNAGRINSYDRASKMGIDLKKEWIATKDERTRLSHGMLDGVRIAYKDRFSNGLLYPADPDGAPAEVYNCRCTLRAVLPNVNDEHRETYAEWLDNQKQKQITQKPDLIADKNSGKRIDSNAGKYRDITKDIQRNVKPYTKAPEYKQSITVDGVNYAVDGINVYHENTENSNEFRVAKLLQEKTGQKVDMLPVVRGKYHNKRTADYLINGENYDLKTTTSDNKNKIRELGKSIKGQADRIIIDVSGSSASDEFYIEGLEKLFSWYNTMHIKEAMLIRDDEIVKALKQD